MIQPLLTLKPYQAMAVAKRILIPSIETEVANLELAMAAAQSLPKSWSMEWALTIIRKSKADRSELIARSRFATLRVTAALWATCSNIQSNDRAVEASLSGYLLGANFKLPIELSENMIMKKVNSMESSDLPLNVHLGQITMNIADILALQRGDALEISLPNELQATVHIFGGAIGRAKVKNSAGQFTLEIEQLFTIPNDSLETV